METPVEQILEEKGNSLVTVSPDTSVAEAVKIMNEENIGAVVVLDGDKLAGIFTERDVLRRVVAVCQDPASTPVKQVMTHEVACVKPETPFGEALVLVNRKGCRHLPVVDHKKVVGLISVRDLINTLTKDQQHRISELESYIMGNYGP